MNFGYWQRAYEQGYFGDTSKIKFVMPNGPYPNPKAGEKEGGFLWYKMYKKDDCDITDDCSYDLDSITKAGDQVAAVINNEKELGGWNDGSNIYLAGYS